MKRRKRREFPDINLRMLYIDEESFVLIHPDDFVAIQDAFYELLSQLEKLEKLKDESGSNKTRQVSAKNLSKQFSRSIRPEEI